MSKASWLWPHCCRKGAQQPDLQEYSEGREHSDLTYNLQTNCGLTVVGREQSDLTYNSANYQ